MVSAATQAYTIFDSSHPTHVRRPSTDAITTAPAPGKVSRPTRRSVKYPTASRVPSRDQASVYR
ncbi:MAG: hypothetical protein HYW06_01435 [Gemmatimonadetes bacterium]|nr:hypothetical protein [Gemmatimonadota bacterium]